MAVLRFIILTTCYRIETKKSKKMSVWHLQIMKKFYYEPIKVPFVQYLWPDTTNYIKFGVLFKSKKVLTEEKTYIHIIYSFIVRLRSNKLEV